MYNLQYTVLSAEQLLKKPFVSFDWHTGTREEGCSPSCSSKCAVNKMHMNSDVVAAWISVRTQNRVHLLQDWAWKVFCKSLFSSVTFSPNNSWYKLWSAFARIAWLRGIWAGGAVLVWRVNNSLNKHPFNLWLPSKGNINCRCSGRRKKSSWLSQRKPGGVPHWVLVLCCACWLFPACFRFEWGGRAAHTAGCHPCCSCRWGSTVYSEASLDFPISCQP